MSNPGRFTNDFLANKFFDELEPLNQKPSGPSALATLPTPPKSQNHVDDAAFRTVPIASDELASEDFDLAQSKAARPEAPTRKVDILERQISETNRADDVSNRSEASSRDARADSDGDRNAEKIAPDDFGLTETFVFEKPYSDDDDTVVEKTGTASLADVSESSDLIQLALETNGGPDGSPPPGTPGPPRGGPDGSPSPPPPLPDRNPRRPDKPPPDNKDKQKKKDTQKEINDSIDRGEAYETIGQSIKVAGAVATAVGRLAGPGGAVLGTIAGVGAKLIGSDLVEYGRETQRIAHKQNSEFNNNYGKDGYDPVFIDTDSDGLDLAGLDNSEVAFDLDNDGYLENLAWSSSDAILVRDLNSNGTIDNGEEISFSEVLTGVTDLDKLDSFDANDDGLINQTDAIFSDLMLWDDADNDGISQTSELQTLSAANITSIDLTPTAVSGPDIVYWHDTNGDGLIDASEIYENLAEAPAGAVAAQAIEGGYLFQTATINTTTGTLTAYAVGLEYNPLGGQAVLNGDDFTITYEDGAGDLWRTFDSPTGDTFDLTDTNVTGAFGDDGDDDFSNTDGRNVSLSGGLGDDTLSGGAGDDRIVGGGGADDISGGEGDDGIVFDASDLTLDGGGGYDVAVAGTSAAVTVNLGSSNLEAVFGNDGADTLTAGTAVDVSIFGEGGNDTITGGSGDDYLSGGSGADSLTGGAGDDTIWIDASDTSIDGGAGTDTIIIDDDNGVTLNLSTVNGEIALGGAGNDTISASGSTNVMIDGSDGDDTITGGSGDDRLVGEAGDDDIDGGAGLDAVLFNGVYADYQVTGNLALTTVVDQNTADGDDGTDTLENVERLIFSDQTIHRDGTNYAPVAVDESWRLRNSDAGSLLSADNILDNDWDYDRDHLHVAGLRAVQNGKASITAQGDIIFNATSGYVGDAAFGYEIGDGHNALSSAESTLEISQALPDDDLFTYQWGLSWLNVTGVWDDYTGQGVKIAIHDDGVDQTHPDISTNYDATIDDDPGVAEHGTFVAAAAGGERDGTGIVGVAYDATLAVYELPNIFDWSFTGLENFDVVNNSWTQNVDALDEGSSGTLISNSLNTLVDTGRGNLGTINVFIAGNNRDEGDSPNYSDGPNSRYAITTASINLDGTYSDFSSPGSSILVSAPGGQIVSADTVGSAGFSDSTYVFGADYFTGSGTSAAGPLVSGVIALMLEANSGLGWRDIQEILAYSAWNSDPLHGGWDTNGAANWNGGGLQVSHDYGFGLVDAQTAVRLAESWQTVRKSSNEITTSGSSAPASAIPDNGSVSDTINLATDIEIDHVEVTVSIDHTLRGDLVIELTSPDGTTSVLMNRPEKDPNDPDDRGALGDDVSWRFYTTHHWGEHSQGDWKLTVRDLATGDTGTLTDWSIDIYGDTPSNDDTYIYTIDYGSFTTGVDADRRLLSDASGNDILNASPIFTDSQVDLRPGETSLLAGNELTIASGTTIEDAYLGVGDDSVLGNDAANKIYGGQGNDQLEGGLGADTLDGEAGSDWAAYTLSNAAVQIDLLAATAAGGHAASDTLTSIENLIGSDHNDTLAGDNADNTLIGGDGVDDIDGNGGDDSLQGGAGNDDLAGDGGDDILFGGLGDDTLDGGAGTDTAHYIGFHADYTINTGGPNVLVSGPEGSDTLSNIEFLKFIDQLVYVAGPNTAPVAGNHSFTLTQHVPFAISESTLLIGSSDANSDPLSLDTVYRSDDGIVSLDGDNDAEFLVDSDFVGTAVFDYALKDGKAGRSTGTVSLTVAAAYTFNGTAGADTFIGLGSTDTAHGNDGDDILNGGYGNDTLNGGNDADLLSGGEGNDSLNGDAGDDILLSDAGNDTLDGGAGTDIADYSASDEAVTVDLGLGTGSGGHAAGDTLSNIETVKGSANDDTLKGDSLANTLQGEGGDDIIEGGAGNDTLSGGSGNDTLIGGAGDDSLSGHDGDDILRGGAGADNMDGGNGVDLASYLDSASGVTINLKTSSLSGADTVGDVLTNIEGIEGSEFVDSLTGSTGDNVLWGAGGNDTLNGDDGNDVILGGAGNDTINGGDHDDTLEGGLGDDSFTGGKGNDTFKYNLGDGDDSILETGTTASSADRLEFYGIAASDIILTRSSSPDDLTLSWNGGTGSVFLDEQFDKIGWYTIENFAFDDGTVWTDLDVKISLLDIASTSGNDDILGFAGDDQLEGGLGNDALEGGRGNDTYTYSAGDGADTIWENGPTDSASDEIVLHGIDPGEVTVIRSVIDSDDVTLFFDGGGSIKLDEHFNSLGWHKIEEIKFDDLTTWDAAEIESQADASAADPTIVMGTSSGETLNGTASAELFIGLGGNDTLLGGDGADTYRYASGDGNDFIDESSVHTGLDRLVLTDLNAAGVTFSHAIGNANDLTVTVDATGEVITIDDQFAAANYGVEEIEFADATVWNDATITTNSWFLGSASGETINGLTTDDVIVGNGGDDTLLGQAGADTYRYASGDGNDFIDESSIHPGIDRLKLTNLNIADVTFSRLMPNTFDLVIMVTANSQTITIDDQFWAGDYGIEEIEFADATVWNKAAIQANTWILGTAAGETINGTTADDKLSGEGGNDTLLGKAGSDTYRYASGDGADVIDESGDAGTDRLVFTDLNIADLTFSRTLYDLLITDNATSQQINVDDQFWNSTYGIEEITFADSTVWSNADITANAWLRGTTGNDTINGSNNDDAIFGDDGDDTIYGKNGSDTYHYESGDGSDFIDESSATGTDTLAFEDLNAADVTLSRLLSNTYDLGITVNATGHTITMDDQFWSGDYGIEQIKFADSTVWDEATFKANAWMRGTSGNDTITGTSDDDTIFGDAGDDTLSGGAGNDTFIFKTNSGNDTINSFVAGAVSDDVIKLDGLGFADAAAALAASSQVGSDTVVSLGVNGSITLAGITASNLHEDDFIIAA